MIVWQLRITFTEGPASERDAAAAKMAQLITTLNKMDNVVTIDIDSEPAE